MFVRDNYPGPFEPDTMLPEQFTLPAADASPERRLMAAVLEDAIKVYLQYKGMNSRKACCLFREVEEWFLSTDMDWPYSFENISAVLGLDTQAVRGRLLRKDSPVRIPEIGLTTYYRTKIG